MYPCICIQPHDIFVGTQRHGPVHSADEPHIYAVSYQRNFSLTRQQPQRFCQPRKRSGIFYDYQSMRCAIMLARFDGAVDTFQCFVKAVINRYQDIDRLFAVIHYGLQRRNKRWHRNHWTTQ